MTTQNSFAFYQSLIQTLSDPRIFIRRWFEQQGIKLLPNGDVLKNGRAAILKEVQISGWLDYREQLIAARSELPRDKKINGFRKEDFLSAIEEYAGEIAEARLREIIKTTNCTQEDLSELEKFVAAVVGPEDKDLYVAVFAHTIWQIKRKMRGLPIKDHLMAILFGIQGSGKSTAINLLLAPIEEWVLYTSLSALQDERRAFALAQNYVAFTDEMQQAHRTDIEVLKNIISAPKVTPRVMRENLVAKIPQNCTFIGATNKSIAELINDPTGMRRFLEIKTLDRIDWATINSIDYLKLIRGIDENKVTPYIDPFSERIDNLQAQYVAEDHVTAFLEDAGLLDGGVNDRSAFVSAAAVYTAYRIWCDKNGYKPQTSGGFGKSVSTRGLGQYRDQKGHSRIRGYHVMPAAVAKVGKFT